MSRRVIIRPPFIRPLLGLLLLWGTLLVASASHAAEIHVSPDLQVVSPSPTVPITVFVQCPGNCDWIKVTVDGQEHDATVGVGPWGWGWYGTFDWDSSQAGNPSEHTASATAHFTFSEDGTTYEWTLDSTDSTTADGDGRPVDFVIADLRFKSFQYVNAYTLRYQASDANPPSPDPAIVPSPQFVYDLNGQATTSGSEAGDIQGKTPAFKIRLHPLTGGATIGFKLKWDADPDTGDPELTLYDNTSGDPTVLTGGAYDGNAQKALLSKVAMYSNAYTLNFYVKFTQVSPQLWYPTGTTYLFGNTLYATLAQPTAPMAEPWVGVLDRVCYWAAGVSDADTATYDLTQSFYNSATYNGGHKADTQIFVDNNGNFVTEEFYLLDFINGTATHSALAGQCNDFADFLVCLSNAAGSHPLQAQRSASLADMNANTSYFWTNSITASNEQNPANAQPTHWFYHQWAKAGTVSDGSLRFGGVTTPSNLSGPASGTDYYTGLVGQPPSSGWNPQSPFVPTIKNHRY